MKVLPYLHLKPSRSIESKSHVVSRWKPRGKFNLSQNEQVPMLQSNHLINILCLTRFPSNTVKFESNIKTPSTLSKCLRQTVWSKIWPWRGRFMCTGFKNLFSYAHLFIFFTNLPIFFTNLFSYAHLFSIISPVIVLQVVAQSEHAAVGAGVGQCSSKQGQHVQQILTHIVVLLQEKNIACVVQSPQHRVEHPSKHIFITANTKVLMDINCLFILKYRRKNGDISYVVVEWQERLNIQEEV